MEILELSLAVGLVLSSSLNAYLIFRFKAKAKSPIPTLEATDLLHDLTTRGEAMVRVEVVDPSGLLMWRGGR